MRPPLGPLPPDGDDWFAWAPAGRLDLRAGAMAPMPGMPRALLFGEREGRVHLRLLPGGDGWVARTGTQPGVAPGAWRGGWD